MKNVVITPLPFIAETTQTLFRNTVGDMGALVTFTGIVRAENDVTSLRLTHYPEFTEKKLKTQALKQQ